MIGDLVWKVEGGLVERGKHGMDGGMGRWRDGSAVEMVEVGEERSGRRLELTLAGRRGSNVVDSHGGGLW